MERIEYWSAEFIERRMAEHKLWQHAVECSAIEEIISEVQALPPRAPKRSGWLFELKPEHVQTSVVPVVKQ
jgi:hypothetical protein